MSAVSRIHPWWQEAVVYEVYPRSFADSDGDGIGDLAGVRSRLPYLSELGVDAIWMTPFYPSPLADGGYDVSDYRDVDPRLGTLAGFDELVAEAAGYGIRVIVDLVPNHCSSSTPPSGRRWPPRPAAPSARCSSSGTGAARTAASRPTTGSRSSTARPGRGSPSRTAGPASRTCTCSTRDSPTGTGATPRSTATSKRHPVLARPPRRGPAHRRGAPAVQGPQPGGRRRGRGRTARRPTTTAELHELYRLSPSSSTPACRDFPGPRTAIGEVSYNSPATLMPYLAEGGMPQIFNSGSSWPAGTPPMRKTIEAVGAWRAATARPASSATMTCPPGQPLRGERPGAPTNRRVPRVGDPRLRPGRGGPARRRC